MSKESRVKKDMPGSERKLLKLFPKLQEYCSPVVIGEVNDVYVEKSAKVVGEDVPWHTHDHEDKMFHIVNGSLRIELRDKPGFALAEGEFLLSHGEPNIG